MIRVPRLATSKLNWLAGTLLGLCMLLLVHRYWGIDHDATLYLGMSLARQSPEIFANDLFFLRGSQGNYTLFPLLTGSLIQWIAPGRLFFWGGLAGLLVFAGASWYCLRALLPAGPRYWAWLGVLVLPSFYGRAMIFSYAEPFLTPRPFAEGLALVSVGMLARGHRPAGIACLFTAGVLHPLQALAAALVIWPWLLLQDRRWWHALWLALPIAAAGAMGVEPFDGLFTPLGKDWLAQLRAINGQLFITGWATIDYQFLAFDTLLLACAAYRWRDAFGRWCLAALAGLATGTIASFLLVDVLQLALPTGLQLWRVHWLSHWSAMAALAMLLRDAVEKHDAPRALLLGLASLLAWGAEWLWIPCAMLYGAWPVTTSRLQAGARRLLGALFAAGLLMLLLRYVANELENFQRANGRLDFYALDKRLVGFPLVAFGLPLMGMLLWQRASHRARVLLFSLLLLPGLAVAALRWDITAPNRRALDANAGNPALFGAPLPKHAQVYWDYMGLLGSWSVLGRADYYDPQQLSGLAFNKGTVDAAATRIARMSPLIEESAACQERLLASAPDADACRISEGSLERACAADGAGPDYLVLPYRQSKPALGSWTMRDDVTGDPITTYWLYDCREIAGRPGASGGGQAK